MINSKPNDNGNGNVTPPTDQVDQEASRLANKFGNPGWNAFYCKAIYRLGFRRVKELEGRVQDSKYPGRLFTKLVKEELHRQGFIKKDSDDVSR